MKYFSTLHGDWLGIWLSQSSEYVMLCWILPLLMNSDFICFCFYFIFVPVLNSIKDKDHLLAPPIFLIANCQVAPFLWWHCFTSQIHILTWFEELSLSWLLIVYWQFPCLNFQIIQKISLKWTGRNEIYILLYGI